MIQNLQTWENKSFQSERHMETSYVLTVAFEAEESWNMPLTAPHISASNSNMPAKMKAMKPASARTRRIGTKSTSQSIQNIGYRTKFAKTHSKPNFT